MRAGAARTHAGQEDIEGGAAALTFLDPRATAVELGEAGWRVGERHGAAYVGEEAAQHGQQRPRPRGQQHHGDRARPRAGGEGEELPQRPLPTGQPPAARGGGQHVGQRHHGVVDDVGHGVQQRCGQGQRVTGAGRRRGGRRAWGRSSRSWGSSRDDRYGNTCYGDCMTRTRDAEASRLRLRPILMTSLAFVAGLIPLMFATGASAVGNRSISTSAAGGMITGVVFGLLIIPLLFVIFQSLQEKISRKPKPKKQPVHA